MLNSEKHWLIKKKKKKLEEDLEMGLLSENKSSLYTAPRSFIL